MTGSKTLYSDREEKNTSKFKVFTLRQMDGIEQLQGLDPQQKAAMKAVAHILPFRVNEYVLSELIDWNDYRNDPIFKLTFPQQDMLEPRQFADICETLASNPDPDVLNNTIRRIRAELNPHPGDQQALNVPQENDESLHGLQHKYRETVLFFPSQGQTCHSYCSFCFRWAQFVGDRDLRFASHEAGQLHDYLRSHREVSDVLITGGDPMVMKTRHLAQYLDALTQPGFDHIQTIRIGTKALSFWPHRFVHDDDADELLQLLERLVAAGKHVAIMAHFNHYREFSTDIARTAIRRIRDTGAVIRSQSPLIAHINDDADVWARMWQEQVKLGVIPYYMFVERNTGARNYFEVPLARAWEIYQQAIQQVSGLARTARGPSMSSSPGKIEITGITEVNGEKVFALRFLQARNPDWVQRPFFARFDPQANWLDDLQPAFGEKAFFFSEEFRAMQQGDIDPAVRHL